jgi:hypothetical protein
MLLFKTAFDLLPMDGTTLCSAQLRQGWSRSLRWRCERSASANGKYLEVGSLTSGAYRELSATMAGDVIVVVFLAMLETTGVQIELLVARYLTGCPCREQARPAWCTQGFSTPHCKRLARNITDGGQAQVPCHDRRQGASRIKDASRNSFLLHRLLEGDRTKRRVLNTSAAHVAFQSVVLAVAQDTFRSRLRRVEGGRHGIVHGCRTR